MNDPMKLPELPPMQAPAAAMPSPTSPSHPAASPPVNTGVGIKRLRQAVTYLASGGMALVLAVTCGELVLKDGLKPTDIMATIEAQTELSVMNQKLGHARGEHVLTEADYQSAIAHAQREGAAKAEIVFQRDLAAVQADKERVVGAYTTLYQRTNLIAQVGLQMEAQAQQFRQQLIAMTNGGRATVLGIEDGLCALGSIEACEAASKLRADMIAEANTLTKSDLTGKVRELMSGIDDPATFVTHDDIRRHGVPAVER